jgi:hypothetical protein
MIAGLEDRTHFGKAAVQISQEPRIGISGGDNPGAHSTLRHVERNLLYTGVTRGKRLVGQKKAIAIAVRNASGRRRWSKLAEWLRPCSPVSRRIGAAG